MLARRRARQYERATLAAEVFLFELVKTVTKYKQVNYVRTAEQVQVSVSFHAFSYDELVSRYEQLATIEFECTLRQYNERNQRKLLTKKLRQQIMERDNYTCQCCGKHMPDTVGLQIDHIVPVSKGGKTVPSNLQVLCSLCNARKSNK